jgi:hypothetical protein
MRCYAILASGFLVTTAGAQQLPRATFEVTYGNGPHAARYGETYFRTRSLWMLRLGTTVRMWPGNPRIAPVIDVSYSVPRASFKREDCPAAPNGTCRRYFPQTGGSLFGVGIQAMPARRLTLGGTVGLFGPGRTRYLGVNAGWPVSRRITGVVDWRDLRVPYEDGHLPFRPLQAGLRAVF